ncbi:MAG: toprim domain-containing protein [Pseudomonadales bacterium]|nr:toprim domain-containing protein [Pseudomonadales bacterium]
MKKRNSTEMKRRMEGRWLSAFSVLAPALDHAINNLGTNVPCPINGGTDGFRLFKDANDTGGGAKQSWRIIPEGIDMLMWVNDWSFPKVYDELEAWLGDKAVETGPIYIAKPKPVNEEGLRKWLNRIWKEALPLEDLKAYPARAYFGYRWVKTAALSSHDVRFHPCLNYKDKKGNLLGKFGAVLTLVRNNEGEPVALHRTFITKGGLKVNLGKAHSAKTMTPSVKQRSKGRHIRLFEPQNGYLGISEGLETALAVFQVKEFPVWPGLSNTILQSFVPPKGVHTVLNFVDKDRNKAGENSAEILRTNLMSSGIRVFDLLPPTPILDTDEKGVDWADQLKRDPRGFDLIDQVLAFARLKHA